MLEQVAYRSRRNMRKLLSRRNDDRLDIRRQLAVGIGDGTLRLEIDHVPDSTHDMADAQFAACVYGQIVIINDAYTLKPCPE